MPPTKPFPLTKEQLQAWLDDAEQSGGTAGVATSTTECPLARAYRHVHTDSDVRVRIIDATTSNQYYILTDWQKKFVLGVDSLPAPEAYWGAAVRPQQARDILERLGDDE